MIWKFKQGSVKWLWCFFFIQLAVVLYIWMKINDNNVYKEIDKVIPVTEMKGNLLEGVHLPSERDAREDSRFIGIFSSNNVKVLTVNFQ